MTGRVRVFALAVLAGAAGLSGVTGVPARAVAVSGQTVVSAPLPPGRVSSGLPRGWRPPVHPTQVPGSAGDAHHRALARVRALIAADNTRPHPVVLLPPVLAAWAARVARARAEHLIGPVRASRPSRGGPVLSALSHEAVQGRLPAGFPPGPGARGPMRAYPAPAGTVQSLSGVVPPLLRRAAGAAAKSYGATYSYTASWDAPPRYDSPGYMWVRVTNTGNFTWTANNFELGYHLYYSDGRVYNSNGLSTTVTVDVLAGHYVDIYASLQPLPAGTFKAVWDMCDLTVLSGSCYFTAFGVPASAAFQFTVPHYAPSATLLAPLYGATVSTLTPQLSLGVGSDGTLPVQAEFQVCGGLTCSDSGWVDVPHTMGSFYDFSRWTVPAGYLFWDHSYTWVARVRDSTATTGWSQSSPFSTVIPPPAGARLGVDPAAVDAAGVNMFLGDYTRHETDLSLPAGGMPLAIERYYNSADTTAGAFGTGWSSILDMHAVIAGDGTVTVTYADGRQVSYRANPDGTYAPSSGETGSTQIVVSGNILQVVTGGLKYYLVPVSSGPYSGTYRMSIMVGPSAFLGFHNDTTGHVMQITYQPVDVLAGTAPPGRSLYVTWNAGETQVTRVSAAPAGTAGAPSWSYSYTGSDLTQVCDAVQACTTYGYTSGKLTTVTRPDGAGTTVTVGYTGGYVSSVTLPQGPQPWTYTRLTPTDGSPASLRVQVWDPENTQVNYEFYPDGRLYTRWLGPNQTQLASRTWGYDGLGRLASLLDENLNTTEYGFNNKGYLSDITLARGSTQIQTAYTYYDTSNNPPTSPGDPRNGLITAVKDPNGNTTTTTYTDGKTTGVPAGLIATRTLPATAAAPSGAVTAYAYTCQDGTDPLVVNDPAQPTVHVGCGLLASVTDPAGHVTRYGYDHYGDQTQVITPSGQVTNQFYDPWGCVTEKLVVTPQNTAGTETDYTCDGNGRVLTETDAAVKNPVTGVTHQRQVVSTYDGDGNLAKQVISDLTGGDTARTWTYAYDGNDRQTTRTVNGTRVSSALFDAMGNQTDFIDGNLSFYHYTYSYGFLISIDLLNFLDDPGTGNTTRRTVNLETYRYTGGRLASVTDAMSNTVGYTYTSDNLLATQTLYPAGGPANGVVLHTYTYDNAGNLVNDTQDSGGTSGARTTTWTYDAANQPLTQTVDPGGLNRVTSYTYDTAGNQTGTSLAGGGRTESASTLYNSAGQLWETVVHNDATPDLVTEYSRDAAGQVLAFTDPRGTAAAGSVTAPDPAFTTTNTYDALERLSTTTAPPVQAEDGTGGAAVTVSPKTTYGYDTFGDLTDVKDPRGLATHTTYDAQGRRTEVDYPAYTPPGATTAINPSESWAYDGNGNILSHTDRAGQVTSYKYDMRNRPYLITLPPATASSTAGTFQFIYDDDGNLLSQIDPTGAQTLRVYGGADQLNSLTQVVRNGTPTPDKFTTSYKYDDYGEVTAVITAHTTETRGYDDTGELASDTITGRGTTSYSYDAAGRATRVTDPLGRYTQTVYDLAGHRTQTTAYSAAGAAVAATLYTTGLGGNVTAVTDPNGNVRKATYDALNRLTTLTDPAPSTASGTVLPAPVTTIGYDAAGHQTRVTDANLNTTYQTYNTLGLPETRTEPATAAQPSATDRTWVTSYDAVGHPVKETQPGGVVITDSYDNLGNLTGQSGAGGDASATRTFGYDLDGRLTSATTPGGTQTFTYDDRGLLTASSGPEGATTSSYDAEGRPLTQTDAAGTLSYTYSGALDVGTATSSLSGLTTTYTRDSAGQVKTAASTVTATGADAATRTLGYDDLGRVTSDVTTSPGGTVTASLANGYDDNGNLTSQTTSGQLASPHAQTNVYDADNRLIRTVNTTAATGTDYGYDPAGNRTSLTTWAGTQASHTTTGTTTATFDERNRIQQITAPGGTTSYTWTPRGTLATTTTTPASGTATTTAQKTDAFGQLISNSGQSYSYDSLGRLATFTPSGDTAQHFSYPGLGAEPVSDGASLIARAFDGTPLAAKTSGTTTSLLQNTHGDIIAGLATATGAVTASRAYDPFGGATATTGTASALTNIGYQGSWTDPATGLAHAGTRWYNPAAGAFTAQDTATVPLTSATATNGYLYAGANPATSSDPTGQDWLSALADPWTALSDTIDQAVTGYAAEGISAIEGYLAAASPAADAAVPVVEATTEGLACVAGGCEALVAGAVVVVAVAGTGALIYAVVNHNGTLTPQGPAQCGDCTGPNLTQAGSPLLGDVAPSQQTLAAKTPPVHVTGWQTHWTTRSWSTVTKWWDDTYLYIRTDYWTLTTTYKTTDYSNGTTTTNIWTRTAHTWDTIRQLLIDLSHPIKLTTPDPGPAQQPAIGGTASDTGQCGEGGSPLTCAAPTGALPPGALPDKTPQTQTGGAGGNSRTPPTTPSGGACLPGPGNGSGPVQPYEVGRYGDLVSRSQVGDQLAIHHVPQGQPAGQVIPGYSYPEAPAIALPAGEHYQIPNLKGVYNGSAQDLLTRDIANLRTYTNTPESSIQQLQGLISQTYPDTFGPGSC